MRVRCRDDVLFCRRGHEPDVRLWLFPEVNAIAWEVRLWLQADIRREPAERPLMTQAGHLAPDSSDLVLSLAPGRNL